MTQDSLTLHLQTTNSVSQPALLKLGLIDDAVEFGHFIFQLLCPPAQTLGLQGQPSCLALHCTLGCLHFSLLADHCCAALRIRTGREAPV